MKTLTSIERDAIDWAIDQEASKCSGGCDGTRAPFKAVWGALVARGLVTDAPCEGGGPAKHAVCTERGRTALWIQSALAQFEVK